MKIKTKQNRRNNWNLPPKRKIKIHEKQPHPRRPSSHQIKQLRPKIHQPKIVQSLSLSLSLSVWWGAKANNNHCHSNTIANPSTQSPLFWPASMCDEELVGCYCCTRRQQSEAMSMLVELETRRSESSGLGLGLGLIGSSFLWGCWP